MTTPEPVDVVIAGAGQAGAQAALSLRKGGFAGSIVMLGDEPYVPYNRPMLSKEFLLGHAPVGELWLRPEAFWQEHRVEVRTGSPVALLDADRHEIRTADDRTLRYGSLVLAAGGSARSLAVPGARLEGVVSLRTIADAAALRVAAVWATSVVVVGGGYLGLEIAAGLTRLGARVTVVEALGSLLNRVTSPVVSEYFLALHEKSGVRVLLDTAVERIDGVHGRVREVRLGNGVALAADLVVVAIGMTANDGVVAAAGAECDGGVVVDARCRTTLPDVYAVGDCARRASEYGLLGERIRLECVQSAIAQARIAADDILGLPYKPPGVPWFWSNQFDTKLKSVGLFHGYDDLVVDGEVAAGTFAVDYLRRGVVIARDCVNTLAGYARLKKDLEQRAIAEFAATGT